MIDPDLERLIEIETSRGYIEFGNDEKEHDELKSKLEERLASIKNLQYEIQQRKNEQQEDKLYIKNCEKRIQNLIDKIASQNKRFKK